MQVNSIDSRIAVRKVLRGRAQLRLKGMPPIAARTIDISLSGLCVMAPEFLGSNQSCVVMFEIPSKGQRQIISATANIVYSICVGTQGFRIGLHFSDIDSKRSQIIHELDS